MNIVRHDFGVSARSDPRQHHAVPGKSDNQYNPFRRTWESDAERGAPGLNRQRTPGLSLSEALAEYSDQQLWQELKQLEKAGVYQPTGWNAFEDTAGWARYDRLLDLQRQVERSLLSMLNEGELIATGYDSRKPIDSDVVAIPAEAWEHREPDFKESRLSGRGFEVTGIRIVRRASIRRIKSTIKGEKDCRRWMKERAAVGPPPATKKAMFDEAKRRFSVSWRDFHRVWAEVAPMEWRRPGRKS